MLTCSDGNIYGQYVIINLTTLIKYTKFYLKVTDNSPKQFYIIGKKNTDNNIWSKLYYQSNGIDNKTYNQESLTTLLNTYDSYGIIVTASQGTTNQSVTIQNLFFTNGEQLNCFNNIAKVTASATNKNSVSTPLTITNTQTETSATLYYDTYGNKSALYYNTPENSITWSTLPNMNNYGTADVYTSNPAYKNYFVTGTSGQWINFELNKKAALSAITLYSKGVPKNNKSFPSVVSIFGSDGSGWKTIVLNLDLSNTITQVQQDNNLYEVLYNVSTTIKFNDVNMYKNYVLQVRSIFFPATDVSLNVSIIMYT